MEHSHPRRATYVDRDTADSSAEFRTGKQSSGRRALSVTLRPRGRAPAGEELPPAACARRDTVALFTGQPPETMLATSGTHLIGGGSSHHPGAGPARDLGLLSGGQASALIFDPGRTRAELARRREPRVWSVTGPADIGRT